MATFFDPSNHLRSSFHQNPISQPLKKPHPFTSFPHFQTPKLPIETLTLGNKLVINGGPKLCGHVNISGSKNSALAILAGTLCCSGVLKLSNIPNLSDIQTMVSILKSLGVGVEVCNGEMLVDTGGIRSLEPCSAEVGKIRAGFFVLGPLLARFGEAVVGLPGGCDIGSRPIDLYVRGLRALGAIIELREGKIYARAANGRRLVGGTFHLDYPSVGATETLMMAACMADGVTSLSNVAQEPEVVDLAQFLIDSGACVKGVGSRTLVINGMRRLYGHEYTIIPDRIEAGTFMIAAAITGSSFSMSPVIPGHLSSLIDKLSSAGCKIQQSSASILKVSAVPSTVNGFKGFDIRTGPFPRFPTDLQPQIMALLATRNGSSIVEETVFEGRMSHVKELQKLGARIELHGSTALVHGKEIGRALHGSRVVAADLRSGASLVLAGLAAEGITEVEGGTHIDRGYENLEMKLSFLGADIQRRLQVIS